MLIYESAGSHLTKFDAYREYAYSVDVYGAYQPASFIYLCREQFSKLLRNYGGQLVRLGEPSVSQGLVFSLIDEKLAIEISQNLESSKNVLALIPKGYVEICFGMNKQSVENLIQKVRRSLIQSGFHKVVDFLDRSKEDSIYSIKDIWFEEVHTDSSGRLLVTVDTFISDGYFLDNNVRSEKAIEVLKSLSKVLTTFKYPLIRFDVTNCPPVWISMEPMTLILEIENHCELPLENVAFEIKLPEDFELVGPDEIYLERILPRQKKKRSDCRL